MEPVLTTKNGKKNLIRAMAPPCRRLWEGGFNFETTGIPILFGELQCKRAFLELYVAVSFVDVTKFAFELLVIYRPLYVISFSNGVKNCIRPRKKC